MQAGHGDRAEGQQTSCALSPPELMASPAPAETVPASTGSRPVLRPASRAPGCGIPAEAGR